MIDSFVGSFYFDPVNVAVLVKEIFNGIVSPPDDSTPHLYNWVGIVFHLSKLLTGRSANHCEPTAAVVKVYNDPLSVLALNNSTMFWWHRLTVLQKRLNLLGRNEEFCLLV